MPRRGWIVLGLLLAAPVAIAAWSAFAPEPAVGRDGSEEIGEGRPLDVDDPPRSYRIVYLEESGAGESIVTNTRKVWVERPFRSRVETWSGGPLGEEQRSARASTFGLLVNRSSGAGRTVIATPPTIASSDLRPGPVLGAATEPGLIERRERRRVLGRECQVYRFGGPVAAGDLTPLSDGPQHADVCFDERGLMLEELWKEGDEVLRRRIAVEMEVDLELPDDLFGDPESEELDEGAGSVTHLGDDEPAGTWQIEPPERFRLRGAYDVRFPPGAVPQQVTLDPPRTRTNVWVDGVDVLVVDQDPSLLPFAAPGTREDGRKVDLGEGLTAELFFDLRTPELRVATPDSSFVRIFGTLSPDEVADLGQTLRSTEGNR